jgi:hypothetical protein
MQNHHLASFFDAFYIWATYCMLHLYFRATLSRLDTRMAHGVQLFDGMIKRRQHTRYIEKHITIAACD